MPRKSLAIILIAVAFGVVFYNLAPTDFEPGNYTATIEISSLGIDVTQELNQTMVLEGVPEDAEIELVGLLTNFTIEYQTVVLISTSSSIVYRLSFSGSPVSAEQVLLTLHSQDGFNVSLRPGLVTGQTFTFEYQPLVNAQAAIFILVIVGVLWFSEGINLVATSILIPILIVLFDIRTPTEALTPFFDPAVALILGGFLIGRALVKYELDKRLALFILSRSTGSGSVLLFSVMCVTAFLSMWISNTASAAIMIPIALAVINRIRSEEIRTRYGKALVLGVAYSATLGGVGSLVGSTPNPLAASYISQFLGVEFSFVSWLPYGLPVLIILLPVVWQWLMFRFKIPKEIEEMEELSKVSEKEYLKLGTMSTQQKMVLVIFVSVVLLWFTQKLPDFLVVIFGWTGHGISSAIVALMGGLALLGLGLLDEKDVSNHVSWSALLILGSGIALGGSIIDTGVSTWMALQMGGLGVFHPIVVIVIIGVIAVILTMVASNTAAAVILIPIAIPLSISLGIDPILVTMVIAIGVTMDFALPTGTPPSTIAYSTGKVEMREMVTTGLVLDIIATLVLTLIVVWIWGLLGIVTL
jgi:sodium-dependent dicarboxylate transporter 2/3/5